VVEEGCERSGKYVGEGFEHEWMDMVWAGGFVRLEMGKFG
jgi:hypothetical protein